MFGLSPRGRPTETKSAGSSRRRAQLAAAERKLVLLLNLRAELGENIDTIRRLRGRSSQDGRDRTSVAPRRCQLPCPKTAPIPCASTLRRPDQAPNSHLDPPRVACLHQGPAKQRRAIRSAGTIRRSVPSRSRSCRQPGPIRRLAAGLEEGGPGCCRRRSTNRSVESTALSLRTNNRRH